MSDKKGVQRILSEVVSGRYKVVTEDLAKQILTVYGLQVPPYVLVNSAAASSQGKCEHWFPAGSEGRLSNDSSQD